MQADMPGMQYGGFHFAEPGWFILLLVIPLVLAAYRKFKGHAASHVDLEKFADRHLLPHLLKNYGEDEKPARRALWFWSAAFALGVVAMAGPRWNYEDVKAFRPEQDLVILLDLSPTMDITDVKPSRLARARQEIDDILSENEGISIGLVAFAAVPHMVSPLTDDMRTMGNLLPSIETSLVSIPGSNLKPALDMAADMLNHEQGNEKSVLLVSDGNFSGSDAASLASSVPGAAIYTMGVGTAEGAPLAHNGTWLKGKDGKILMAGLRADRLQALSAAGHGAYIPADYTDNDTRALLAKIGSSTDAALAQKKTRIWQERFYIPALIAALLVLPWFRRGYVFPVILFVTLLSAYAPPARADMLDLFRNRAQQGERAFEKGDYNRAGEVFDTPYRRGVAQYKAHQYDKAEQSFAQATGPDADYNRGNAQMMQHKPEEAIASYESALRQRPDDAAIKHNLEIAKKLADEKKKKQEQQKNQQQQGKDGQKKDDQNQQSQSQQNQKSSQDRQNGQQSQNNQQQQKQSSNGEQQGQPKEQQSNQNRQPGNQQQQSKDQSGQQQQSAQQQSQGSDQKTGQEQKDRNGQNQQTPQQQQGKDNQPQNGQQQNQPQQGQDNRNKTGQNQTGQNQAGQDQAGKDQAEKNQAAQQQQPQQQQTDDQKNRQQVQQQGQQPQQSPQQQGAQQQGAQQQQSPGMDQKQAQPDSQQSRDGQKNPQDNAQQQQQQQNQNGQQPGGQPGKPEGRPGDEKPQRSQKDIDADQWLNRVQNDPGTFLRNQFLIEDRRAQDAAGQNGTTESNQ